MSGLVDVRDLAAGYEGRTVIAGVSATLKAGELVGLIGPNGAGKSTLVRAIAGLAKPLAGSVAIQGDPIERLGAKALARRRAYMPQHLPPDEGWRVREVVAMGRFAYHGGWGSGDREGRRAVEAAIAMTKLGPLADALVTELSGGQRQRVYLARALAQEAPVLILDEPTAHLDLGHQIEFFRLLREVMAERPLGVLAVLHDLNLAAQFCHALWVADAGEPGALVAMGAPEAVLLPGLVERVFGLSVQVRHHPETGTPYLVPLEPTRPVAPTGARLHVVAGGGTGERLIPALHRRGYRVSVGAVNMLDSDEALAERLGLEAVVEAPFSPLSEHTRARLDAMLASSDGVVVADVAWGDGNLANLEALLSCDRPIWLVADTPMAKRDFTGGRATRLWDALVAKGARPATLAEVLAALPGKSA